MKSKVHTSSKARRTQAWILVAVLLALGTSLLFAPTVLFDFTNYDDVLQVSRNELIRELGPGRLLQIFSRLSYSSYYPVRLLSLAVNYRFGGLDPSGYHLTNVLLHVANAVLALWLFARLTARWGGGVARFRDPAVLAAAALFAVHPVVVEPVAWVAGREELLMVFFALAGLHAQLGMLAAGREQVWRARVGYVTMLLACACACMSNAVAAVLPFIMVAQQEMVFCETRHSWRRRAGRVLARFWPFFLLSAATIGTKLVTQAMPSELGSLREVVPLAPWVRVLTVFAVYGRNILTLLWPRVLITPCLNEPAHTILQFHVLFGIVMVGVTIGAIVLARKRLVQRFGLVWFLLALAPSSQLVPHHIFRADRFLYLPLVGLCCVVADALARVARRKRWRVVCCLLCVGTIGALAVRSVRQIPVWHNSITLFEHTLRFRPGSCVSRLNLGLALLEVGDVDGAVSQFEIITKHDRDLFHGHRGLGLALVERKDHAGAIRAYSRALRIRPTAGETHADLGAVFAQEGAVDQAVAHYSRALDLDYEEGTTRGALALALGARGETAAAMSEFARAIELEPDAVDVRFNYGLALARQGKYQAAIREFSEALRLNPAHAQAKAGLSGARLILREAGGEAEKR